MKRSIYSKINRKTLLMSFISAVFVCVAVFLGIAYIRDYVIVSSESLGNSAAYDSKKALERQAEITILALVENKALISDEKLAQVSRYVTMLANNATEIMSNPEKYGRREILYPDSANKGRSSAQFQHTESVSPETFYDEVSLMGNVSELMFNINENNENIYVTFLGTETGAFFAVDKDSDKKLPFFEPRTRPWYIAAKQNDGLIWSDVYEDAMGRGLEITCVAPYYGPGGKMYGVVGAAMQLTTLNEIVSGAELGESGYAFMLGKDGRLVVSNTITQDEEGNIIRQNLLESENPNIRRAAEIMVGGGHGIERFQTDEGDFFLSYFALKTLPWSLGSVLSVEEAIRPALESEQRIIELKGKIVHDIDNAIALLAVVLIVAFLLTALLNVFMTKRLSKELSGPITELADGAGIIGAGDINHRLSAKTGDEVEVLADAFNTMIDDIKKITAEKERISAELNVARRIQASMLPCIFPPFPGREEFDIVASMLPAKEVGGDFYDFFFVGSNTIAVAIADVSGKGVPAALFMVIAKTLIKNNACLGKSPDEVFETVNSILCENNDAEMFVTAFLGYLDTKTGKFTYVNAGHNPPLIGRNGVYEYMSVSPGIMLAAFDGVRFKASETVLGKGDSLLLYTDGITEAFNENNEMFGAGRLLDIVNRSAGHGLNEMLVSIKNAVDSFAGDAEQADDITILKLKYFNEVTNFE